MGRPPGRPPGPYGAYERRRGLPPDERALLWRMDAAKRCRERMEARRLAHRAAVQSVYQAALLEVLAADLRSMVAAARRVS